MTTDWPFCSVCATNAATMHVLAPDARTRTMMSAVCCDQVECWSALARAADGRDGDMYTTPMDDDDA